MGDKNSTTGLISLSRALIITDQGARLVKWRVIISSLQTKFPALTKSSQVWRSKRLSAAITRQLWPRSTLRCSQTRVKDKKATINITKGRSSRSTKMLSPTCQEILAMEEVIDPFQWSRRPRRCLITRTMLRGLQGLHWPGSHTPTGISSGSLCTITELLVTEGVKAMYQKDLSISQLSNRRNFNLANRSRASATGKFWSNLTMNRCV